MVASPERPAMGARPEITDSGHHNARRGKGLTRAGAQRAMPAAADFIWQLYSATTGIMQNAASSSMTM